MQIETPLEVELGCERDCLENGDGPQIVQWIGAEGEAKPSAYLHGRAITDIQRHGIANRTREVGGLLLGSVVESEGRFTLVTSALPARHNRSSAVKLTFTHESWRQMLEEKDREYPESKVVGWYHTHPGHGVFLSDHDLFIHRSFFRQLFQVAIVFDCISGALGLFAWSGNNVVRHSGVAVYGEQVSVASPCTTVNVEPRTAVILNDGDVLEDLTQLAREMGSALEETVRPIDEALSRLRSCRIKRNTP